MDNLKTQVELLHPKNGDHIVVTVDCDFLPPRKLEEYMNKVRDVVCKDFPDNNVIVKTKETTIECVSSEELQQKLV